MVPSLAGCAAVGVGVVELMRWKILVCVRGPSNDAMDVLEAMHHRILMIARARLKMPAPPADLRGHRSSPCLVRLRSYRSRHNCFAGANPNQRSSILEKRGGSSSVQSSLLFFARNGRASELTSGLDDVRLAIDPSHPPPNPNPFDSDYTDRTAVGGWLLAGWLARCLAGLPPDIHQTFSHANGPAPQKDHCCCGQHQQQRVGLARAVGAGLAPRIPEPGDALRREPARSG